MHIQRVFGRAVWGRMCLLMLVSHGGLLHRSVRGGPVEPQSGLARAPPGGKPLWESVEREMVVTNNISVSCPIIKMWIVGRPETKPMVREQG